ncbi:YceK/YidQ family lipoprotein [Entomomonas asaccharolytica]|uniref:YceK/YidQ family lipoprotein n=1 Tax=Entomomonas asaccharolytica TaxID=2785331 RepID=A0A974NDW4_9GAMM|nr:YceK/YidQ family lipoprotein [Entomomonas asaccharolytica]QQP84728.1 YceK/YidQ family lipoprotein [Entomomonas asaccharolytica]
MRIFLHSLLLMLVLSLVGCASSITHGINYSSGNYQPPFYSGIAADAKIINEGVQCTWNDDCANRDTVMISLAPLAVLDFPLSLILDTLLVPIDALIYYNK